ncbi:hypothetical protein Tco_0261292 [Tanacetum coccineum]
MTRVGAYYYVLLVFCLLIIFADRLILFSFRVEMDLLSFIQTVNPTKVRVGERQRAKGEPKLLDTNVGRVVILLPIAPARAECELDASVDKLFDEGGSGNLAEQGDSASGGHGVGIQRVSEAAKTVVEDAAPVQPMRQRKRKTIVSDASKPSHPPKKLREDHGILSGASMGGKSRSAVQRLFAGAMQNAKAMGEPILTLPFVTSSVSATPKREDEDSSHHSGANIAEAEVDSFARPSIPLMIAATTVTSIVDPATIVKEKFVESSVFGGDSSGGRDDHTVGGFSDLTGSDFIIDDGRTCHEMVDAFAPPKAARQMSLSAEVRMRAKYNIRERRRLNSVMEEKISLLMARDGEIENLKAQLLVKEAKAAEAIRLHAESSKFEVVEKSLQDEVKVLEEQNAALEQEKADLVVKVADLAASVKVTEQEVADLDAHVHELETSSAGIQEKVIAYENFINQFKKFQDEKMRKVNEKFDKLCADFGEMTLHLEEKFYPHLLTIISGRQWLLTHCMELAIAKCLNSTEYLSTLGAAIGKAVEKGMQEELSAGITHGIEGRKLIDVTAYNPSTEADYLSALQRLQSVNFSLIVELKSNKDASVDTIMNLLRLEDTFAERLGLTESQPHVDQLMVPIHHSLDQRVIGASTLSLSLDVSNFRVRKIKKNIANHVSALRDVFVPLSDPLSAAALEGTEDDYEVAHADGQESTGADGQAVVDENVNPFPNIDDAELNVLE